MQKRSLLLLVFGYAVAAFGQSNYAVVTGTVTDPQHLPVVGASVQLAAASTGAVRRVVTNQRGLFEASALLTKLANVVGKVSGCRIAALKPPT